MIDKYGVRTRSREPVWEYDGKALFDSSDVLSHGHRYTPERAHTNHTTRTKHKHKQITHTHYAISSQHRKPLEANRALGSWTSRQAIKTM